MNLEVKLQRPMRGDAGRFSSIDAAFRQGAASTLKKLALLEHVPDPAEFLTKLFRTSNFGYGKPNSASAAPSPFNFNAAPVARISVPPLFTR